jgi:hypothetical protein
MDGYIFFNERVIQDPIGVLAGINKFLNFAYAQKKIWEFAEY